MKKLFGLVLLSVAPFSATLAGEPEIIQEPDYFSGFFIGASGAFHMTAFNGSSSTTSPEDIIFSVNEPAVVINQTVFPAGVIDTNDISSNHFDGYYGVRAGVGKVFNHRWYTGFVGFGEWGSQSSTDNSSSFFDNASATTATEGQVNSTTTLKISNDYGIAFKPGFLVAPKSMVYGKIGAAWANVKISNSSSGASVINVNDSATGAKYNINSTFSGSSSNEDNKIALLLGIGFEQFIYRDFISLNVEYNYANYGHVSTSTHLPVQANLNLTAPMIVVADTDTLSSVTTQASADARVSTLLGGINFYFGSHWF